MPLVWAGDDAMVEVDEVEEMEDEEFDRWALLRWGINILETSSALMEFRPALAALGALHPVLAFGWKFKGGATAVMGPTSREDMERAQRGSPSSACLSLRGAQAIDGRARPGLWARASGQLGQACDGSSDGRSHEPAGLGEAGRRRLGSSRKVRSVVCWPVCRQRATPGGFRAASLSRASRCLRLYNIRVDVYVQRGTGSRFDASRPG